MTKTKGPMFLRYVAPIMATLKELGYSGNAGEVADRVIEQLKISEREQEATTSNGHSRVRNQIGWARFYLVKAGYLDASRRGVWTVTEAGRTASFDTEAVHALFKKVHKQFPRKTPARTTATEEEDPSDVEDDDIDYRSRVLDILRSLPPAGFERICQRLLRESGFQRVIVTGGTGDGGIDGHGVLEINPLVTFKVLFQCKRYGDHNSVSAGHVRDFRGAMQGRADKGLILTTGSFTADARKEAGRDGAPAIELVDGDKLVAMFERAELGLRPKQTFDVDETFFEEFRK